MKSSTFGKESYLKLNYYKKDLSFIYFTNNSWSQDHRLNDRKVNVSNVLKIDVSSFNSGIYFVKLNTVNGEITKKLILN